MLRVRLRFRCFAHVRDLQVFKDHGSKAIDQRTRGLVVEVVPLVAYPAMGFGQGNRRAFAPMRATLLAVLGLLQPFDLLQPSAVGTWVLNGFPSRERGKMEESQVNTLPPLRTGATGSSSTSHENVTYQWFTSRLMVTVFTWPTSGRCSRTNTSPILERVSTASRLCPGPRVSAARAKPDWGYVNES